MLPGSPANRVSCGTLADPKLHGKFFCRSSIAMREANLANNVVGELGVLVFDSSYAASLADHISHVVGVRPEPQMRRIHACWVISTGAVVENVKPIGNRAVRQHPAHTMR